MSLFPSASAAVNEKSCSVPNNKTKENKNWLENKSFASEAADLLRIVQHNANQEIDGATSQHLQCGLDIDTGATSIYSEYIQPRLLKQVSSDSSNEDDDKPVDIDTSDEKVFNVDVMVDKNPDQNNVYFNKPYKVFIPRYRRESFVCIGLSPHFQIVFEKRSKKKKRNIVVNSRYYQFDDAILQNADWQGEDMADDFKTKVEKLNIETRENKTNINAWLQLVALQEEIFGKNVKMRSEKKVAILDKAIGANPRNYQLKLKRLALLESISEDSDREWKNLVFQHPDCKETWLAYIKHTLSSSRFTVPRTLKVFEKCVETLSAVRKQGFRSEEVVKSIEEDLMHIFAKLIQFLVESGHSERTLTLLQLMLEINVRSQSAKEISDIKQFYESGVPLLGEPASKGWDEWYRKFQRGGWVEDSRWAQEAEEEMDVDDVIVFEKSVKENWLEVEAKRSRSNILRWRSNEDCEDPSRRVSYEDIKGFIFLVNEDRSRIKLFEIFLQVLGTVPENQFANDKVMLGQPCQLTHALHSCDVFGDISALQPIICSGCKDQGILPRTPHHEFLQEVFEQIATSTFQNIKSEIGALCIGYYIVRLDNLRKLSDSKSEQKKTYKSARKLAKCFLKNSPADFTLWSKLAKVEFFAQNLDECRKITFNALSMCKTQSQALLLCRLFSELVFETDRESVKQVLCALADNRNFSAYLQQNKEISAAVLLRVSRSLERLCEELGCVYQQVELNSYLEPSEFASAVCCHIVFGIVNATPISFDLFQKYLSIFRTAQVNGSLQAKVDLRHIHTLNIRLKTPDYLRDNAYRKALLLALEDIPDDPSFLNQLCQIEVGSSLTSIARRLLSSSTNPILVFYSVYFEMLRSQKSIPFHHKSAIPPRILNHLERAVSELCDNTFIWRLYACLSPNSESVLTRAVAHCPWSKNLACDRIRLGKENVEDVITLMNDKGLRIRTPVEEIRLLIAM